MKQDDKGKKIKTVENSGEDINVLTQKALKNKYKLVKFINNLLEDKENIPYLPFGVPTTGEIICGYGNKIDPLQEKNYLHSGVDITAPLKTPIRSPARGIITFTGQKNMKTGLMIEIKHKDLFYTRYMHLSKIIVKRGQKVKKGQIIGYTGNTGIVKAAHLHYEVLDSKKNPIDPIIFLFLGSKHKFSELYNKIKNCNEPLD